MISELASPAGLLLSAIFAYAGFSKLRNPRSTKAAMSAFGLPPAISRLLGPIEVAVAVLLLVRPNVAALLAALLLVGFSGVVVRSIQRRLPVRCGCFGGSDDRPVGIDTLVRNGLLLAACALVFAGLSRFHLPTIPSFLVALGGAVMAALVLALLRVRIDTGSVFAQRLAGQP